MITERRYICSGGCGRTRTINNNCLPLEQQRSRELPATAGFCIYCPNGVFRPEAPIIANQKKESECQKSL